MYDPRERQAQALASRVQDIARRHLAPAMYDIQALIERARMLGYVIHFGTDVTIAPTRPLIEPITNGHREPAA
jgi:hypothetical protein